MSKDLFMEVKEEQLAKEETAITLEMVEMEYKFLGWENGWSIKPPEVLPCKNDKHQRRHFFRGRRGEDNTVACDICKYYFKYDSSD
jgi:hypothetical protein